MIIEQDSLDFLAAEESGVIDLIYIDPPFNTGKKQKIHGRSYSDSYDDYMMFLGPRLHEAKRVLKNNGSLFVHVDWHESHYVKVYLDGLFGRDCFMNEIIWAYDYGGRSKKKWSAKHDCIFWYVKDPKNYTFNFDEMDRIPYMAPGLVGKEKAARGKTPTDCFSDDTDLLTADGWKNVQEIEMNDEVATVSPSGELLYERPIALQSQDFDGHMVGFQSRDTDILVTPNHNMYVRPRYSKEYVLQKACEVKSRSKLLNQVNWLGNSHSSETFVVPTVDRVQHEKYNRKILGPICMQQWAQFMGFFLSEGFTSKNVVGITKSKEKKPQQWKQIADLLDDLGMSWKYYESSVSFIICNKSLYCYMKQFGKCDEKYIPRYLLEQPKFILESLWGVMVSCDGRTRGGSQDYLTTSKKLADDVQELLFKIGFKSKLHPLPIREGRKQLYRVSKKVFAESVIKKSHIKRVPYSGKVYCCTLPSYHTVVARRNGMLFICGQCWWHTIVATNGKERLGYPTQKPMGILRRIIKVHTNPGDLVLDFFAGSGTTGAVCKELGRDYIMVDSNPEAIKIMRNRLDD